jgi:hypothetical protein
MSLSFRRLHVTEVRRQLGIDEATRRMLLYAVLPLWMGAGLADWWMHRRTDIEHTAGSRESAIHALMMTEAGLPTMLGLFFEPDAGVLAAATASLAAHEATAVWDVTYAESRRKVTPAEQHVHSLLEVVPLMATASLAALHWDQALAMVGRGPAKADFRLRPKAKPLSSKTRISILAAVTVFAGLPYLEELVRCLRVSRSLRSRPEAPEASEPTPTLRIPEAADERTGAGEEPSHLPVR